MDSDKKDEKENTSAHNITMDDETTGFEASTTQELSSSLDTVGLPKLDLYGTTIKQIQLEKCSSLMELELGESLSLKEIDVTPCWSDAYGSDLTTLSEPDEPDIS